jgi:hypothetical protein
MVQPVQTPSESNKLDSFKLRLLKTKVGYTNSKRFFIRRLFVSCFCALRAALALLWSPGYSHCRTQGHVLPLSGWRAGELPLCSQCGRQVFDTSELRKTRF